MGLGWEPKGDLVLALQLGGGRTSRNNKQMAFPSKWITAILSWKTKRSKGIFTSVATKDLARCCSGNEGPILGSGSYVCRALILTIALFSVLTPLPYTKYIVTIFFFFLHKYSFFCLESGPNMYQLTWCNGGDKRQPPKKCIEKLTFRQKMKAFHNVPIICPMCPQRQNKKLIN
jgi:hypothetical protein